VKEKSQMLMWKLVVRFMLQQVIFIRKMGQASWDDDLEEDLKEVLRTL